MTPPGSGHVATPAFVVDGDFNAPIAGLYNIFTTVTFSNAQEGLFKLVVTLNNNFQTLHPGLISTFENAPGLRSLSVFGTVRLQAEDTISVFVHSSVDKNWVILGNSDSTFCVEFIGFFGYIPGFSSYLNQKHVIENKEWKSLMRWKSNGGPGLFQSGVGFSSGVGTFVAVCDGIYQISANVKFFVTVKGYYKVALALDGIVTGNVVGIDEPKYNVTFVLTLSVSLKLRKGNKVTLLSKGTGKYTIETESGYFGILLNNGGSADNPIPGNVLFYIR